VLAHLIGLDIYLC